MQVIGAPRPSRVARLAVARSAFVAGLLLAVGSLLAWMCLATPLVSSLIPAGRPTPVEVLAGILGLTFAIVMPAGFVVLGIVKAAGTVAVLTGQRQRRVLPHLAGALGPEHLAAADLVLPDGRRLNELVLGPFGVVVIGDVPPAEHSRCTGRRWEIRDERGRWIPAEAPVDRASRDADRVRRWLASHDRDFIVRVYAAIVTEDPRVERSATCAVVTPDELRPWLEQLPAQRGLTPARREDLFDLVRSVSAGG